MEILRWLNEQLLRMQWLSDLVAWLLGRAGMDPSSRLGGSVHFFIYDTIKIFLLLAVLATLLVCLLLFMKFSVIGRVKKLTALSAASRSLPVAISRTACKATTSETASSRVNRRGRLR